MFLVPFFLCSSRVWEFANKQILISLWMQLFFQKIKWIFFPSSVFFYIWSNVVHAKLSTNNICCLQFSTSPTENFFFSILFIFALCKWQERMNDVLRKKVLCVTIVIVKPSKDVYKHQQNNVFFNKMKLWWGLNKLCHGDYLCF